eukprot:TRINITY_DN480_c0_g1_i9.p1 TRINITY_DN480_c0_g1~~TRINITY_DN480_c0_g1_i9.p1  ORF type:complete len:112 (-),score=2.58 TRINITY_DN480_c0_g1_i9:998-1333(-)
MAVIGYMRMNRRRALRRERVFRDMTNPIDAFDDLELFTKFRFRRDDIISLTDSIEHAIKHPNRRGALTASSASVVLLCVKLPNRAIKMAAIAFMPVIRDSTTCVGDEKLCV